MVKSKPQAFSWTQPVCQECWQGIHLKTGRAMSNKDTQFCCFCKGDIGPGEANAIRVNPGTVPYPTIRKDEDGNS